MGPGRSVPPKDAAEASQRRAAPFDRGEPVLSPAAFENVNVSPSQYRTLENVSLVFHGLPLPGLSVQTCALPDVDWGGGVRKPISLVLITASSRSQKILSPSGGEMGAGEAVPSTGVGCAYISVATLNKLLPGILVEELQAQEESNRNSHLEMIQKAKNALSRSDSEEAPCRSAEESRSRHFAKPDKLSNLSCARSGVDVALWDLVAKLLKKPLYELLGNSIILKGGIGCGKTMLEGPSATRSSQPDKLSILNINNSFLGKKKSDGSMSDVDTMMRPPFPPAEGPFSYSKVNNIMEPQSLKVKAYLTVELFLGEPERNAATIKRAILDKNFRALKIAAARPFGFTAITDADFTEKLDSEKKLFREARAAAGPDVELMVDLAYVAIGPFFYIISWYVRKTRCVDPLLEEIG